MYGAQLYFVAVGWGCGFGFKRMELQNSENCAALVK